jgi:hypothetical protein
MKHIRCGTLQICAIFLKPKQHNIMGKCPPRCGKGNFVLILLSNLDLIIFEKVIHKRKDFVPYASINKLINKSCLKLSFGYDLLRS